jgi:hypothetical protein
MSAEAVEKDSQHAFPPCNDIGVLFRLSLLDRVIAKAVAWRDGRTDEHRVEFRKSCPERLELGVAMSGFSVLQVLRQ